MEIVLILVIFIALLLWVIWLPFIKQDKTQENADLVTTSQQGVRVQTNIDLYHEHKAEIEKDFKDGGIDEESYQYLLTELDSSLLQDIETAETVNVSANTNKSMSIVWPVILSCFVTIFSVGLYLKQGTLENLMKTPVANHSQQQSMSTSQQEEARQQQMIDYINQVQEHLTENPDDGEAWYNLGQTYVGAGEFDHAIASFEQVIRIEGEHADLLGAIAQASYYKNNQQIDEHVQGLIDKALALDINDPSTNILLGMHNFIAQEYEQAIGYWQRIIDANRQGVNIEALQEAVKEAKTRLSLPIETVETAEVSGPNLSVSVSLSEEVSAQLANGEDKVVFVYALPTTGQRMPLAAVKMMASDLPKVVSLNNSQAMSPQNNLGSVEQVNIFAIVSNQGGVGIKPGDFKGETHHVSVDNKETINLVISNLVE